MEVMMPLPDVFNKFNFSVGEHDGYTFREQKKFTSKFDDIYKIIDQENGDIVTIVYDFSSLWGTTLYISYLTTERNESGATYVVSKRIIAYNTHYIPKNALIHDMYMHKRFLEYFKTCLRYNEPEIAVLCEVP
jgi:hypothetical protein